MTNLTKLEFTALDISGKNYLSWILDAEIHLDAMNLGHTIKQGNEASAQERAKAMIFLRHHIHEGLKTEYLTVKNPFDLWNNLNERYDHQKTVILPKARYDWMHLRLQDYKTVGDYNSALFKISSQLQLCGEKVTEEDMLEKTFSTFHASNVLLQQQYRERRFKKYSELISCLLVAEQNNELLMKNHQARPTGSATFPEVNVASFDGRRGRQNDRGRGHGRGRGRGRGCGYGRFKRHGDHMNNYQNKKATSDHQKWKNNDIGKNVQYKKEQDVCYRCGVKGHWSHTCCTPKHLVDLYQASIKAKGKEPELNFVDHQEPEMNFTGQLNMTNMEMDFANYENSVDMTNVNVMDYFDNPNGNN